MIKKPTITTSEAWALMRNQQMIMEALHLIVRNQIGDLEMTHKLAEQIHSIKKALEPE